LEFARRDDQTNTHGSNCGLGDGEVGSILVECHSGWSVGQSDRSDSSGSELIAGSSSAVNGDTIDGVGSILAWYDFSDAPSGHSGAWLGWHVELASVSGQAGN